ncbi:MAG: hypothetical protein L0Y42_04190, partial [Phycisphaerales bacterium]|nr:hypothetical protein [Phycisphaerales bacterium]
MISIARFRNALAAITLSLTAVSPAWCYPDSKELLADFIHYAKIANVEMALASAEALIKSGVTNAELAIILEESNETPKRFDEAVSRAIMVPELEAVAGDLAKRVEEGRLDLARDPKRIEDAVAMLTGTQRERLLAEKRLMAAGEYAVPALLKQVTEGRAEPLKLACQDILEKVGRPAVPPLCEALLNLTGVSQRIVCDVLGNIKHPNAAPYLREVALSEKADGPTRDAARRAFSGLEVPEASLSALYADLASNYFDGHESLIAYPQEPVNNVWSYSNFTGLSPTPVATAIFSEVMAVRTSTKALGLDPTNSRALSLFVAANLKRENDLPEGGSDPIYGQSKYTPEFYATVFGTQTCLDVLGLAIDKLDTPLVRDAITALSKSTGGANLFTRGKGRQPLLEALSYPDRRVQYEAALTLGRALPAQPFSGDYSVVPLLASAVRMGNKSLALVIVEDAEDRNLAAGALQKMGFDIAGAGGSVADVQLDVARAVGVDLVFVRMRSVDAAEQVIGALRGLPKTSAAPVVLMGSGSDVAKLRVDYGDDRRIKLTRAGADEAQLGAAIEAVMNSASGGRITEAEAEEYAIEALSALRDIAISRSPAYAIADAESALVDALATRSGGTRLL